VAQSPLLNLVPRLVTGLPQPIAEGSRLLTRLRPAMPPVLPPRSPAPISLGRLGSLEALLATRPADIRRAQALRYQVFFEEMAAIPSPLMRLTRRDADRFDRVADHVLVVDHDTPEPLPFGRSRPRVVGTYRLLTPENAAKAGGFYSASEFDIARLVSRNNGLRFLELGRSCVLPAWRQKRTIELLWTAVWAYARRNGADVLFGCASFPGADASQHREALAFLRETALAPAEWRGVAQPHRRIDMRGAVTRDAKRIVADLPPLIKAYLRLGAYVGDGAVSDAAFGTTDVLMILPVARIGERYLKHFS
jgi:putative hemolysin